MKEAGHVARMGDKRITCRVLAKRPEEREHLEDLSIDGKVKLKLAFKNWDKEAWTDLIWFKIVAGLRRLWMW
jgi:hypothetical protein